MLCERNRDLLVERKLSFLDLLQCLDGDERLHHAHEGDPIVAIDERNRIFPDDGNARTDRARKGGRDLGYLGA